jgi:flagellar hook protein FlgE
VVQGFVQRDALGNIPSSGSLDDVRIPIGQTSPPQATTEFGATFNLDSAKAEPFSTTIAIFDALGDRHDLTITFTPTDNDLDGDPLTTANDSWNFDVTVPGDEVTGGTAGTPFSVGSGVFAFDGNGQITQPLTDPVLTIPGWSNSAGGQAIDWAIFDENGDGNLTSFADPSTISSSNQNGFGVGSLQTLIIGQDGLISGIFTNGANIDLARIALATFNNENGLLRDGANFFLATTSSGTATVGSASTGGRGLVVANTLELSNVDITSEFTSMIIGQRGYQANSRIITATDEIIQEALSLKR